MATIEQLQKIHDLIPNMNNCEISGDTHHIGIEGNERIINKLVEEKLATIDEFWNGESEESNESEETEEA